MPRKNFSWKDNEILSCSECRQRVPVAEVMRTKDKKLICEECYIPSSR